MWKLPTGTLLGIDALEWLPAETAFVYICAGAFFFIHLPSW